MLLNLLKVILRSLLLSRFYFLLNISGLSIGIACCLVIYLFVKNEMSYDRFHTNKDHIYRVIRKSQINGMPYNIGITSGNFAPALINEYPNHISAATRAFPFHSAVKAGEKTFLEDRLLLADSNFFQFFSYPLLQGSPASVFKSANSLVITKSFSQKYFGLEDPLGKSLRVDDTYDVVVTGVVDDIPGNTHLQFDAVLSMSIIQGEEWFGEWWNNCLNTYVAVEDQKSIDFLNQSFPAFMDKFFGRDFQRVGNRINLGLEPLNDIYFNYDTRYETNIAHGDRRYVYVFATIGFVLLFLAAVNYVNLSTAQASRRMKEVGVRKSLGSSRSSIAFQFLGESFFLCGIAAFIALAFTQLTIPALNSSLGTNIPDALSDSSLPLFLLCVLILLSGVAGAYPAFLLAAFKPVKTLKGNSDTPGQFISLRKTLIIAQFSISTFMIIATMFVSDQLQFMNEKDLGFDSEQVVILDMNNGVISRNARNFKERVLGLKNVKDAAYTSGHPGGFYDASTIQIAGYAENLRMRTMSCDADLQNTMKIPVLAGRFFSKDIPYDTIGAVLLNETAVKQLGFTPEGAIGKRVLMAQFDSTFREVVGVVKDYHFTSLKEKIEPLIITNTPSANYLLVKMEAGSHLTTVAELENLWNGYDTGFPMEFRFLDEVIARLYTSENVQGKIFTLFSIVCVVIACIGIFGLAAFMNAQRRKEISIRKILGASFGQLSVLLCSKLLKLVLIANVITIPVVYFAIREWSLAFPYRTSITPVIFFSGAAAILILSTIIVLLNASKAVIENPADSLRSE